MITNVYIQAIAFLARSVSFFSFSHFFQIFINAFIVFLATSLLPTFTLSSQYSLFPRSFYSHSLSSTFLFQLTFLLVSTLSILHTLALSSSHSINVSFFSFLPLRSSSYLQSPFLYFLPLYSSSDYTPFSLLHFLLLLPISLPSISTLSIVFALILSYSPFR